MSSPANGRWLVAQQVGGIWGETTTVIHEIRPSVSRGHARTPNKTRSHSTPSTTQSHNTPKETESSAIDGRLFVAQQVVGSRGETTTVVHEIRPSVSRQRANTSKKAPRKRYRVPSQPSLLKLPVELRGIIFKQYLLEWTEDTLTPSLVIALRLHSQLYSEVLDLFYSIKACLISPPNVAKVLSMPKSVLKRVLSINLVHNLVVKNDAGDSVLLKFPLGITCPPIDILQHSNIRSLQLTTATILDVEGSTNKEILSLARYAILKLSTIVDLTLKIPTDKISWRKSPQCWSWRLDFSLPIQKITRGLGIPSRWVYDNMDSIGVHWNAAINGTRTLTWTDEKYWQSIKRENIGLVYTRLAGCERANLRTIYRSRFLDFSRYTCLDCPAQSCICHTTPGAEVDRQIERFHVVCNLDGGWNCSCRSYSEK
ncbi:hypothetical protein L207DRAFT_638711 [Hyaloscypha variabilis F]|uniref:Uncharacterized protein n=1 Tax=Hyaloscypha variabilis (strain UAMH 11265 / GT02V1 / F) TaxID=1149755 RepID=A0A2J6R6Q0_HYAVF|nr:hypothetical protein L207DRAFT_638711 [Hyaloscypha variabilis F]